MVPRQVAGDTHIEQTIVNWLNAYGENGVVLVAVFAFLESCVGIGLLVSGAFLLVVATTLYVNELAAIETIVMLAAFGAVVGDHAGFYAGRYFGPGIHDTKIATRYRSNLDRAERLIRRYGALAIFIGRFLPAIRSLVPAMLGLSGFQPFRYLLVDSLACLSWSLALAGIVLGLDLGFGD